jgi:hypothetical protein
MEGKVQSPEVPTSRPISLGQQGLEGTDVEVIGRPSFAVGSVPAHNGNVGAGSTSIVFRELLSNSLLSTSLIVLGPPCPKQLR